ncbi:hypothetical protein SK128_016634, partial [Halocaridina rubra]
RDAREMNSVATSPPSSSPSSSSSSFPEGSHSGRSPEYPDGDSYSRRWRRLRSPAPTSAPSSSPPEEQHPPGR